MIANRNVFRYTGRESTWSNNTKPTGDWANSVTDVYHYRSREYLPAIGQFNRLDDYRPEAMTAGFAGGLAAMQNPNLFGYVEGNPVMWGDPWGFAGDDCSRAADCIACCAEANNGDYEAPNTMNCVLRSCPEEDIAEYFEEYRSVVVMSGDWLSSLAADQAFDLLWNSSGGALINPTAREGFLVSQY